MGSLCNTCHYEMPSDSFRFGCAYETHELKMRALTERSCEKFMPFGQVNGDSNEQIINFQYLEEKHHD